MKKLYRYIPIFSITIFSILFPCLILIFTGSVTPFLSCFAVDKSNRIFIGTQNEIVVYDDGKQINTINPKTSRAYMFTINENGNILLSTSSIVYIMDLEGNVLSTQEDLGADIFNQIQYKKRKYVSANGDIYKMIGEWGLTRIIKNDTEIVYQISYLSFAVKILVIICSIALIIFTSLGCIQAAKDRKRFPN